MSGQIFAWGNPKNRVRLSGRWVDGLWALGLLLAALILFGTDLGGVSLRDWDEGIVAQVARDMGRGELNWLYPKMGGMPYLNKPPLVHGLIALSFATAGVNEWTARWPPAMLTALSVVVLYGIGRELFPQRLSAIFAALVYLTLMPMVRHGRLAMLDGVVTCFFLVMLWCVLRSRRNLRYGLGAGLAFGLVCMTKGVALGLLLGAVAIGFLLWDTPRLLTSAYLWGGLGLGTVPVVVWYAVQWHHYGSIFINANLVYESWERIWQQVGGHQGPPWYYLLELVKYPWPWQLFWVQGLWLAWENRNFSWAKLVWVWTGGYLLAISLMKTKLPWYVFPVYPALALAVGYYLAEVWQVSDLALAIGDRDAEESDRPSQFPLPFAGWPVFGVLAVVAGAGCVYFGGFLSVGGKLAPSEPDLQLMLVAVGMSLAIAAVLLQRRDRQFVLVLFWGMYVSLLLFVSSDNWVWELAEDYPVKPVAEMIRTSTPRGQEVFTSHPNTRPSLDFYSDRRVTSASGEELRQKWLQNPPPYLLLDDEAWQSLGLENAKVLKAVPGWRLVTRDRSILRVGI
ncbi:MAG: ArnT family glycosyltransferase [Actinomycetota bacterium]